jgi:hypothetical protein
MWKIELCHLQDNINEDNSNGLANLIRVNDIATTAGAFFEALECDLWYDASSPSHLRLSI